MTAARREQLLSYVVLGVFAIVAIYPILSIVLLAFHRESDLVTGFSIPDHLWFDTFSRAWDLGGFGRGLLNSFIVAATVAVVTAVLSTLAGYAFGTMRFRGSSAVLPAADRADLPVRGDGHPALLRLQGRRADRHAVGADPAADRAVDPVRHVLDAGVLPLDADRARGGVAPRRRLEPDDAVARAAAAGQARADDARRPRVHVDVERVPARARDDPERHLRTAPLGLALFAGANRTQDPTLTAAAAVLVALPIVIVYVFLQRSFIRGMFAGAVKE